MGRWRVLTLADNQAGSAPPALLVTHAFGSNQYAVCLTDLVNVWEEVLDRRNIIKRALDENASIDPSEGADQLKLLLETIEDALNGEKGNLTLSEDPTSGQLNLRVHVNLPVPLEPLIWSISLRQQPKDILHTKLHGPLFEEVFRRQAQVDSLLSRVAEKDQVISRLVDKLEASGIEVGSVFPGAGSSRGSKTAVRDNLFRVVPGLQPFDRLSWKSEWDAASGKSKDELLNEICTAQEDFKAEADWEPPSEWWKSLSAEGTNLHLIKAQQASPTLSPQSRKDISFLSEDGFQSQDISKLLRNRDSSSKIQVKDSQPAHLAAAAQAPSSDETTEDEDDLDETSTPANSAGSPVKQDVALTPPPTRKLGMLGGRHKPPVKSPSPTPDSMQIDQAPNTLDTSHKEQNASRKLGRIGGRTSTKPKEQGLQMRSSQEPGEVKKSEPDAQRAPRTSTRVSKTPPRETSKERADRKRAELKRDLEEKRKAPQKKKRKF